LFAAVLALLIAGPVGAQISGRSLAADLRLEWSVEQDRRGRPVVSGYIYNDRAGSYAGGVRRAASRRWMRPGRR
jgi:hypothetical protein